MSETRDMIAELQAIYNSEINYQIKTFWDGGVTVRIGDGINGYMDDGLFGDVETALIWLCGRVKELYPKSLYAKTRTNLDLQ